MALPVAVRQSITSALPGERAAPIRTEAAEFPNRDGASFWEPRLVECWAGALLIIYDEKTRSGSVCLHVDWPYNYLPVEGMAANFLI